MSQIETLKSNRRGLMIVLSSPSGAGKTTLTRKLLAAHADMSMSVSATTRKPRPGEVDGHDYYFVTKDKFSEMIENEDFLEHAKVFDNYYGTPRGPVEEALMDSSPNACQNPKPRLATGQNMTISSSMKTSKQPYQSYSPSSWPNA